VTGDASLGRAGSARDAGLIEAFLEMLSAERGARRNTLLAYRRDLADLVQEIASPLRSVEAATLETYCGGLARRGLSPATQARRISALRQFFQFLLLENVRMDDPSSRLEPPRRARTLPKTLTLDEIERLIAATQADDAAVSARDRAIVEMLYASGLRVSELVSLPLKAAPKAGVHMVMVTGKGGKERLVPLHDRALAALAAYLGVRDALLPKTATARERAQKWLFPSRSAKDGKLTRARIFQLLQDCAQRANIEPARVTPHVLRHAFATHLVEGGADLRTVQMLLGHADIATTQIYTHVAEGRLRDLVETKHPLARRKRQAT
jgi:integrase/recombinase XerD